LRGTSAYLNPLADIGIDGLNRFPLGAVLKGSLPKAFHSGEDGSEPSGQDLGDREWGEKAAQLVLKHRDRISDLESQVSQLQELTDMHSRNIVDIIKIGPEILRGDARDAGDSAKSRGSTRR
jgi:hypothetical protein